MMTHDDFRHFLEDYPEATRGVIGDMNAKDAYDLIAKNVGFREIDGDEKYQAVLKELAAFIENKFKH
jgi:hypothetical protein